MASMHVCAACVQDSHRPTALPRMVWLVSTAGNTAGQQCGGGRHRSGAACESDCSTGGKWKRACRLQVVAKRSAFHGQSKERMCRHLHLILPVHVMACCLIWRVPLLKCGLLLGKCTTSLCKFSGIRTRYAPLLFLAHEDVRS